MAGPDIATVAEMFAGIYEVLAPMSWNGLALTYEVKKPDGRQAVLAVLPIDAKSSPDAAKIFEARAKALEGLEHPRLLKLEAHGIRHGVPYLELAYVAAETLDRVVERGPLDQDRALTIARRILQTLELLEAVGIRHLDLTPRNILVAGEDEVKVVGAGIAAILREVRDSDKTGPTGKGSGPSPGRFLPPELLVGDKTDQRTDIYSVGALLHYMTTGTPMGKGGPPPPPDLVPLISGSTGQILSDRYPRAAAMRAAIESTGGHPTIVPPPAPTEELGDTVRAPSQAPAEPSSRGPLLALVVVTVVVVVGVAFLAKRGDSPAPIAETETASARETPATADTPAATASADAATVSDGAVDAGSDAAESTDLLAGDLPEPLDAYWSRLASGEGLTRGDRHLVSRYAVDHRGDPRPYLLLGRDFMARGWSSDAINAYLSAFAADPESRNDDTMRADLLELTKRAASTQDAMRAIARIYGSDALPFVEEALEDESLDPGQRRRLERLRLHLTSL